MTRMPTPRTRRCQATTLPSVGGDTTTELVSSSHAAPAPLRVHLGALDGLRGLAVAAVVVFHAGPAGWLPGGFLGVSLFFTLSGYLITSLALTEVAEHGRLDVLAFYARRVRRLVPALVALLGGIVVLARFVDVAARTERQIIGGLTYTSNWLQITQNVSYAELWQGPGVLDHLWSLAIEEQWYLLFPLLVAAAVRWRKPERLRSTLAWMFIVVVVIAVVGAFSTGDRNVVYLASHTRLGEIAIGGLVALVVPLGTARRAPGAQVIGGVALAVVAVLFGVTTLASGWLYRGGLPLFALLSALILNAAVREGRLSQWLSWGPLRRLGLISYGLYLYHWPISVVLSPPRVSGSPVMLFVVRLGLSLGLSELSYRLIEVRIRGRRWPAMRTVSGGVGALAAGTAACVGLSILPVSGMPLAAAGQAPEIRVLPTLPAGSPVVGPSSTIDAAPVSPDVPTTVAAAPALVVVFGDSVADWLLRDGGTVTVPNWSVVDAAVEGCDGARGMPTGRGADGTALLVPETCGDWTGWYPAAFAATPTASLTASTPRMSRDEGAVVVIVAGQGIVVDRELNGTWRGPCSPELHAWYQADVEARLDLLDTLAGRTVIVLPAWSTDQSRWIYAADHVERVQCVRSILRDAAGSHPGVEVVDLAALVCPSGPGRCADLRTRDGVHFDPEHAPAVLSWLLAQVTAR
jgi:peptidoglycan/LPS O-acetylase OafA/YrhL